MADVVEVKCNNECTVQWCQVNDGSALRYLYTEQFFGYFLCCFPHLLGSSSPNMSIFPCNKQDFVGAYVRWVVILTCQQKNTGVVRQTNLLHVKWCIPVWEKDVTRFRKSSKRSNPLWPSWCCGRNELLMLHTTLQNGSIKVDEYKRHYNITTGTFTLQPLLRWWLQQVGRVGKEV